MSKQSRLITIWDEGRYIDLWVTVHFFTGVFFGGIARMMDVQIETGVFIFFIMNIIWEWFEYFIGIKEKKWNKYFDIVISILGFVLMYYLSTPSSKVLIALAFILVILNFWGFLAYKLRSKAKEERIERRKERMEKLKKKLERTDKEK